MLCALLVPALPARAAADAEAEAEAEADEDAEGSWRRNRSVAGTEPGASTRLAILVRWVIGVDPPCR